MIDLRIMSLNGEDMINLIPAGPRIPSKNSEHYWRARLLAAMIEKVNPDIIGLVEAPPNEKRTRKFVDSYLGGGYKVYQGEKRGTLGLAFLIKTNLSIEVKVRSKADSLEDFKLDKFDADSDGIKENYSWWNRVPLEVEFSGGGLDDKATFILIHSKSKGAFIPGDLYSYERLSRANRMKLRAQADAVRRRLDQLVDEDGHGRVVVMGDMNDSPEFDVYAVLLGGCFLEPIMGSIWDPKRIFHNTHASFPTKDRWTIDFYDRIINPMEKSKYGQPSELRSWIDHIIVSPDFGDRVKAADAGILHKQPVVKGLPRRFAGMRGTDHHPPYVEIRL